MTRWRDEAERLCYDGERIEAEFDLGESAVVVTSHRVLAFTPGADGANYRAVDRPNVDGVARTVEGSERAVATALKALVVGAVLLGAGSLFSLDGLAESVDLSGAGTAQLGMGGMLSMLQQIFALLALLDDALVALGALVLLGAAAAMGWYAHSRTRLLRLSVAGEDDLVVPAPESDDEGVADRLEHAITPDERADGADGSRPTERDPLENDRSPDGAGA